MGLPGGELPVPQYGTPLSSAAVSSLSSHLLFATFLRLHQENASTINPSHAMEMPSRPRRTSQTTHIRTRDRLRAGRDTDRESLESTVVEDSGREGDDQEVLRSTGVSGEVCRSNGGRSGPATGLELCRSPFSPSCGGAASLLSPLQSYASPFKLQGVVGKSQAFLQAFSVASELAGAQMSAVRGGDDASEYAVGEEFNGSDDSDQGDLDRSLVGRKDELTKQGGQWKGDGKRQQHKKESSKGHSYTHRDFVNVGKKRMKRRKHKDSVPFVETDHDSHAINSDLSAWSSDSASGTSESERGKREVANKKRRKAGEDIDGNITWTDESVKFLFETYDTIHQRLCEQNNGKVKYQKKWTSILKAMQERFGKHFTKKQCQSKYWCVRRECSNYRYMSSKIARVDPAWNPSIAGRELLKPKFYDVWFKVSRKDQGVQPKVEVEAAAGRGERLSCRLPKCPRLSGEKWRCTGSADPFGKHHMKDCSNTMREMQRLMHVQLEASEKREEGMKYRAVLMMELLAQHIEHVEERVSNLEEGREPQLYLLERINNKLEKVLDGFSTLNENLSMISYCISKKVESQ